MSDLFVCLGYYSVIYQEMRLPTYWQFSANFPLLQDQFRRWNCQRSWTELLTVRRDQRVTSAETLMGSRSYHHLITPLLGKCGQKMAFEVPAKSLPSVSTGMHTVLPVLLPMTAAATAAMWYWYSPSFPSFVFCFTPPFSSNHSFSAITYRSFALQVFPGCAPSWHKLLPHGLKSCVYC